MMPALPEGPWSLALTAVVVVALGLILAVVARRSSRRVPRLRAPVRFTSHAHDRMAERDVAERDVLRALARPDRTIAATYEDRSRAGDPVERDSIRLEKDLPRRTLKVWVPPDWTTGPEIVVKSVAWQHVATTTIPRARIGAVIGRGGSGVSAIERDCDVRISIDGRTGRTRIFGDEPVLVASALRRLRRRI